MSITLHTNCGVQPIISRPSKRHRPWILPVLLVGLLLVASVIAAMEGSDAVLVALLGSLLALLLIHAAASLPDVDGPGPADLVTGLRLGMAIGIGSMTLSGHPSEGLVTGLLLLALTTDAFDGWIARRTGSASRFGARFDLETDAVLLLAASLAAMHHAGPVVLLAPLMRPLWVLAGLVFPWMERPLPPSLRRKVLCALPIFLLLAVPWPLAGTVLAAPVGTLAALLLVVSFSIDLAHQWQHRQTARSTA